MPGRWRGLSVATLGADWLVQGHAYEQKTVSVDDVSRLSTEAAFRQNFHSAKRHCNLYPLRMLLCAYGEGGTCEEGRAGCIAHPLSSRRFVW